MLSSGTSAETSYASVSRRIHMSSSNCFEVGSFSFFRNTNCVLNRKRYSSGKCPVAHLIGRLSSSRNRRLLWPGPEKETTASRSSCRSPVGPGALIGDSLTCAAKRCLFCSSLALSSRSAPVCIALHSRRFAPPRRTPHWWDEFQCASSVESGL